VIDRAVLARLWPYASPAMLDATVAAAPAVFARFHINTQLRFYHFMAQISHESDGGTITEENLNYTTAARIAEVWPKRFTIETAREFVRNPQGLGNRVYNNRMGNRADSNDGFDFRGRGLLQITGRESYENMSKATGLDLIGIPGLAFEPKYALQIAAAEFEYLKCLPACDADDITLVTKRVNGGLIGLPSRKAWLAKWRNEKFEVAPSAPKPAPVAPAPAPSPQHQGANFIAALVQFALSLFGKR